MNRNAAGEKNEYEKGDEITSSISDRGWEEQRISKIESGVSVSLGPAVRIRPSDGWENQRSALYSVATCNSSAIIVCGNPLLSSSDALTADAGSLVSIARNGQNWCLLRTFDVLLSEILAELSALISKTEGMTAWQ
jgi:hypothetical protein